jgi:hypothetical protein
MEQREARAAEGFGMGTLEAKPTIADVLSRIRDATMDDVYLNEEESKLLASQWGESWFPSGRYYGHTVHLTAEGE